MEEIATITLHDFVNSNHENSSDELVNHLLKQKLSGPRSLFNMKTVESFDDLNLREDLLRGVYAYGLEKLSDIQKKCIMPIISSEPPIDVVCTAATGTGKTAAYCISLLQRIDLNSELYSKGAPQALVIVPTREYSISIGHVIKKLAEYLKINVLSIQGGTSVREMDESLNEIQHVIVGTPGRLTDMIHRNVLNLQHLKILIIDEVDYIMNMGFKEEIVHILNESMKLNLQLCFFQGVLSDNVKWLIEKFIRDPVHYSEMDKKDIIP